MGAIVQNVDFWSLLVKKHHPSRQHDSQASGVRPYVAVMRPSSPLTYTELEQVSYLNITDENRS